MFTKITNPVIDIYNGETNQFIGEARFKLSADAEQELLQLVNNNKTPSSLVLMDVDLYQPSESYVPPTPFIAYTRKGILRALFTDFITGELVPIEIRFKYDTRARGNLSGNLYYFNSVEFNNIVVESIQEIVY